MFKKYCLNNFCAKFTMGYFFFRNLLNYMEVDIKFNTYSKLLFLILGTSVFCFVLSLSLYFYIGQQEIRFFQESKKQFDSEIKNLVDLKSEPLFLTIKDNTNWDDFVEFMSTKDKKWYDETLGVGVNFYNVDYMGVYDINKTLIIKTSTPKIKATDFIPKYEMFILDKAKINRFYLRVAEGVVVVYGATIHPSYDTTKKQTKPSGYFFMVRLLDKVYLKNLERITNSHIRLLEGDEVYENKKNVISSKLVLKGSNNLSIGSLVFERNFPNRLKSSKNILYIIVVAFLIILIVYIIYVRKWIHAPLVLITRVLQTSDKSAIKKLQSIEGEYSYIGNLFEENRMKQIELEIAKTKAEENNKLKSLFLANLSHEIRTPMNAIIGFSDLINDSNVNAVEKKEYLKIIKSSGKSLVSIIEDLIEMSKIDADQVSVKYDSINLDRFISDLHKTLQITIPMEKEIDFLIIESINPTKRNILTDETKLKQIMINLISNAIKYTSKGFISVEYRINEDDSEIEFSVKDSGLGIKKSHLMAIFDRFRRIESDYSIKLIGLGLGLSISKAYVEMLGGTINVKSKIGVGSVFSFTIPLKYDDVKKGQIVASTASASNGISRKIILIAEDTKLNFLLLKKILELKGHEVLRAENGQEAIDICRENRSIDLVFMDIKMPVLDGYGALKEIKSFWPSLPIIAQTAYSSPEDIERLVSAGFDGYATKPLNKDKVYELIDTVFKKD